MISSYFMSNPNNSFYIREINTVNKGREVWKKETYKPESTHLDN